MRENVTIAEMNEAIALFDGGSSLKEHGDKRYVYYPKSCAKDVTELQYHLSWDALMPVWQRLWTTVADHFDEDFPAEFCNMCDVWGLYCEHVNINGAHDLLYKAIQWYQNQPPNEHP